MSIKFLKSTHTGELIPGSEVISTYSHFDLMRLKKLGEYQKEPFHWNLSEWNQKESLGQNLLALDIDQTKNKTKQLLKFDSPLIKAVLKVFEVKKENCSIVFTSYGYHIYIFFNKNFFLSQESWLNGYIPRFNQILRPKYFELDKASFIENQYLRVPGSLYARKGIPGNPPTYICFYPQEKASWNLFKKQFNTTPKKEVQKKKHIDLHLHKKIDWDSILGKDRGRGGCRFLIDQFNNQKDVSYNEWIAQISLTSRYNADEKQSLAWSRQFSEKSPKYTAKEFYFKFKEFRDKNAPYTCKKISHIWKYGGVPGKGCLDCPYKPLNQPLLITHYPNMDTGFRITPLSPKAKKPIDHESFCNYLIEQHNIQSEKDGTIYRFNEGYWKEYAENLFVSQWKHLIKPQITPGEIKGIKQYIKNHKLFDIITERKKTESIEFFNNAVVNTRTGKVLSHYPGKNFYKLDFDYDPKNNECPTFKKVLDFAFKNKPNDKKYFLQYMASALFTNDKYHKSLVLLGDGSNGKSTLVYAIQCMFPKESQVFSVLDLNFLKSDQKSFSQIRRSKVAYCSDVNANIFNKHADLLKRLISGENFTYRLNYTNSPVNFSNTAKIILGMNKLPIISEGTIGMTRRFSILNFENKFPESEYDPLIWIKIKKERTAIFNILMEELNTYRKNQTFPAIDQDALDTAVFLGDIKEAFWKECIIEHNGEGTPFKISSKKVWEIFNEYKNEQHEQSRYMPSKRFFTEWVIRKKIKPNKNLTHIKEGGSVKFLGISLRESAIETKEKSYDLPPF